MNNPERISNNALYGTDVIAEDKGCEKGKAYNPKRGAKVIAYARNVLDRTAPCARDRTWTRGLGRNGTANRLKAQSSITFPNGRNSPRATASGTANE